MILARLVKESEEIRGVNKNDNKNNKEAQEEEIQNDEERRFQNETYLFPNGIKLLVKGKRFPHSTNTVSIRL